MKNRLAILAAIIVVLLLFLAGCANAVMDNCPDVKRDNPSTLQGQSPRTP
jgi:PBP1b-binding outer membrane lipoprotein LpoB